MSMGSFSLPFCVESMSHKVGQSILVINFEIFCAQGVKMVLSKIFRVKIFFLSTKVKFLNPQILLIFTGMNEGTVGMLHVKFG